MLGLWTSALMEVHIAAGFLALFWRAPCRLSRGPCAFPGSSRCSLCCPAWSQHCTPGSRGLIFDGDVRGSLPEVTFVITASLYFCAGFKALWFHSRAEQRAQRMMWLYPATVVCIRWNVDLDICAPFSAMKGLLNVLVYSCEPRFAGTPLWDPG